MAEKQKQQEIVAATGDFVLNVAALTQATSQIAMAAQMTALQDKAWGPEQPFLDSTTQQL
ncbi:hypothetical protein HPG69_017763 [Diceros bicornis minor]|uniref:Uncharacterized protein n=1 Tax=Diceros bicornis minor TaxID=77932 RepID=A0A7J7FI10_DICBM|nr:hypothetical protein HPG69_017763 [Diceros bicornis minor]